MSEDFDESWLIISCEQGIFMDGSTITDVPVSSSVAAVGDYQVSSVVYVVLFLYLILLTSESPFCVHNPSPYAQLLSVIIYPKNRMLNTNYIASTIYIL